MSNNPRFTSPTRGLISSIFVGRISTPMARLLLALAVCATLLSPLAIFGLIPSVFADTTTPASIATFGTAVTQTFDTLVSSGTGTLAANTPAGWGFSENTANTSYTAGTGSGTTGDTYSFGSVAVPGDRALGQLRSGTTISTLGATFQNNTGGTITSLAISYVGEQWRLGALNHTTTPEKMDFQYSTNATSLTTGTWTDANALDFSPPITTGPLGALDGNNPTNRTALSSTITGLSISTGATFWIRWTDVDAAPGADEGLGVDDFSITASGFFPGETAPSVTGTSPLNNAINVPVNSNIDITFSESVSATGSAFSIQCPTGSPQAFSQTASPSITFTLNPTADLPYSTVCTVTVTANQISDTDVSDPPDNMALDYVFSFTTADPPIPVATNVIINEIDADTPSADTAEFIELYDGGVGNTSLNGLVVVLYNGSSDLSYNAYDLDGKTTDASGYFVIGGALVPGVDLIVPDGFIQNGQDAVALYAANATDFPNGTAVSTVNVQDAIVYDNGQTDDAGLLVLLNAGQPQVNEGGATSSIGRCPNGSGGARNTSTYYQGSPSPNAVSNCPPTQPPSTSPILISQVYGGGGNTGATYQNDFVELYNRSGAPVDTAGWSIQYTSEDGDSWEFGTQPLGGVIGPGEYYLIALGSGGAIGSPLPAAQINGEVNMSGTSGKVALVNSFDGLVGNCPLGDPSLMDFVGYGSPDCREGPAPAPAPSNTTSIFRQGGGSIDTNNNGSDFATGAPNPRQTAPIQELGPLVLSKDPRNNGFNAPRDASMTVTFTEPVTVVDPWFDITCVSSGQHNTATFAMTNGGRTHVITPNVNFVAGEQCTATILAGQIHDVDTNDSGANTDSLPANHSWSFTVSTGTAPPYASSVHLTFGDPGCNTIYGCAVASTAQPTNFLMDKPEYSVSYNRDRGGPNWVSWHLTDEWFGTLTRVDTFRPDPQVPPEWYRVQAFDYSGSGFDRGHNTPNADRDKETSIPINQATFLMSNMIPQAPAQNQGPWADMEGDLRTDVSSTNEMYIIMGVHGTGGTGNNGLATTIASGNVTVPATVWKVVLMLPKGENDISRVDCSTRTLAVIMPNSNTANPAWTTYITTVDAVEALTGYDFFANLPDPIERCVEAGTNGVNPPLDTDNDGTPDSTDTDDDNDGQSDTDEIACGSDPLNASSMSTDTDGDNQPDCVDPDDDNDGVLDAADNCPFTTNSDQANNDGDALGDVCDPDDDNDGVLDGADNCPFTANSDQANNDGDGLGDACDPDDDNDGVLDGADNCPFTANSDQANNDGDALGDVCDPDDDNDGVLDGSDNCPFTANSSQANNDGDSLGDDCDPDDDNDGVLDGVDNCPFTANPGQANNDGDSLGDICDPDDDNDGVLDGADNCPFTPNPSQLDTNGDGVGDACTAFQFPAYGGFVVGNLTNLAGGATVNFWGSQWSKNNPMSGGSGPSSFKGFENSTSMPTCGSTWTTSPGGSSNPPSTVPQFMAVIVSSSIQKNGSTISGNVKKIIVVQTNPGYGPSPGQAGTGQVVAVLCTAP